MDPFNLELRPIMTEAIFSLIVKKKKKKLGPLGKQKPTVGYCTSRKKKYILEEIYLLKRSSIDRIIFQKRYIELCLRNMRHLLDNAA